jgi:hypothetical protein
MWLASDFLVDADVKQAVTFWLPTLDTDYFLRLGAMMGANF